MSSIALTLDTEDTTRHLGERLADVLRAPMVVYLNGPLGAGKSTLIRAMIRALGVTGPVKSPTYALVEPYKFSNFSIYHFDFYRFFDENEWEDSGFRDFFNSEAICLVEWASKAGASLPPADLILELEYVEDRPCQRQLTVSAQSPSGQQVLSVLRGEKQQ